MEILKPTIRKRSVAIVSTSNNVMYRTVEDGIISTLSEHQDLQFNYAVVEKGTNLEHGAQALDRLLSKHAIDTIFAIGNEAAQVSKLTTIRRRDYTPIVFGGVTRPDAKQLIYSGSFPLKHITGAAAGERNYSEQIILLKNMFQHLNKKIDNIIIPFFGASDIPEDKSYVEDTYQVSNPDEKISSTIANINDIESFESDISKYITTRSLILILRTRIAIDNLDYIIKFGNERGIPICTSDLSSIKKGVTLGIGDSERIVGFEMAKKAFPILFQEAMPFDLPVSMIPWRNRMVINRASETFYKLGINESKRYFNNNQNVSFTS